MLLDDEAATPDRVGELAAGLTLRHYRFDRYKSAKKDDADNSRRSRSRDENDEESRDDE